MKIVRICLILPLLLAAAVLSAGCTDKDGNYESVDIEMSDVRLEGTLYYIRRILPRGAIQIVKVDLDRGRRYVYPAPEGSFYVTDYRDGQFLVSGVTSAPGGGVESDVVGFAGEHNIAGVERIETGYLFTAVPMLSNDGATMAFHGSKAPGDELTVGIYDMMKGQARTLPCPGRICSNARWSSDDKKLFFLVDNISVYYLDRVTGSEISFFSIGEGRAVIPDALFYNDDVAIIPILNGRLRDGGSLVKVNIDSGAVTKIQESGNCSFPGVKGTGMANIILYTKGCFSPPSQGVYLYNLETGEEVRVSDPDWLAYGGGWSDK